MGGFWIRWLEPKLDLSMICFFFFCACVCAIDSIHSDWILPIQIIYIVFCNVTWANSKSIYFLIVHYFILSYLFSSGSQLVWLCCFSLTDPRTSTMHLLLDLKVSLMRWVCTHSCHPGCWYLNQHKEGRMIQLGVWGCIYAWEVGAVGWGRTCWVSLNSKEGLWGSTPPFVPCAAET